MWLRPLGPADITESRAGGSITFSLGMSPPTNPGGFMGQTLEGARRPPPAKTDRLRSGSVVTPSKLRVHRSRSRGTRVLGQLEGVLLTATTQN